MNLPGHRIAACRGKTALKTLALQTLTRCPLTRREREAFGVRPIYRRFPSRAGLPVIHAPNACEKTKRGLSMNLNVGQAFQPAGYRTFQSGGSKTRDSKVGRTRRLESLRERRLQSCSGRVRKAP